MLLGYWDKSESRLEGVAKRTFILDNQVGKIVL